MKSEEENHSLISKALPIPRRVIGDNLMPIESPGSINNTNHVVIVMDGLKELTMRPLMCALKNNIVRPSFTVTFLGIMPWLNIPLSSKTWLDVWTLELEDLTTITEGTATMNDVKHLKVQSIVDLCKQYGVVPRMEVAMGYPRRLMVVERIINLHATWVVFDSMRDRYHRKRRRYYAKKIPCNIVMINQNGEVDMIKGRPMINNGEDTLGQSPASLAPTPKVMISDPWQEILNEKKARTST